MTMLTENGRTGPAPARAVYHKNINTTSIIPSPASSTPHVRKHSLLEFSHLFFLFSFCQQLRFFGRLGFGIFSS